MRPEIYVAQGLLTLAGGSCLAMWLYPSWYANAHRPGDTIGSAYMSYKVPLWSFFGFVFINSTAFNFLPWRIAAGGLLAQIFVGPLLLTFFRSRMQWLGLIFSFAGFALATLVYFDPIR